MTQMNMSTKTVVAILTVVVGAARTIVELVDADKKGAGTQTGKLLKR